MMDSPRLAAVKTLIRIIKDSAYSNIELSNSMSATDAEQESAGNRADRALYAAIVRTVLERRNTLDFIISLFVHREPDITVKCLLYVGAVQLLYMDRIPDSACCDETVKAAKALTDIKKAGFVNGVLRNICRNRENIAKEVDSSGDEVRYSMDKSVCSLIREQYPEEAEKIFTSSFCRPAFCLRVNTLKNTAEELSAFLTGNDVETEIKDGLIYVTQGRDKAVSLIDSGRFYIQGAPSQYAIRLLGAKPGMTVIDVCACPGGKTLGAAIDMENRGRVIAFDIHLNKLSLIKKSADILGVTIIETTRHDSRTVTEEYKDKADCVICDVPCSSIGVMASKPEIRYKNINNLIDLYKTQEKILDASSAYVKPGGILVYSTCTINNNENGIQVRKFLKKHRDFVLDTEKQFIAEDGCLDGFYAASFTRRKTSSFARSQND